MSEIVQIIENKDSIRSVFDFSLKADFWLDDGLSHLSSNFVTNCRNRYYREARVVVVFSVFQYTVQTTCRVQVGMVRIISFTGARLLCGSLKPPSTILPSKCSFDDGKTQDTASEVFHLSVERQ